MIKGSVQNDKDTSIINLQNNLGKCNTITSKDIRNRNNIGQIEIETEYWRNPLLWATTTKNHEANNI